LWSFPVLLNTTDLVFFIFIWRPHFDLYKPKIKTLLHIFDHTVKPVLLYGSEVWGTSMVNKINKEERFLFNLSKNIRTSSDFNKYLKYLNIFKITSSNNGYRPSSPKTTIFVVLSKYNFVWRFEIYDDRNNKQGGNKLRTYRLFKDNISLEKYLLILSYLCSMILMI
jgi:hypothetical protein